MLHVVILKKQVVVTSTKHIPPNDLLANMMTATVLCMKQYPCDEWAVKLDQRPVVIGLRDVKIYVHPVSHEGGYESCLRSVTDIRVGMKLILHEMGVWNVNTSALHSAKVSLERKSTIGTDLGGEPGTNASLVRHEDVKCTAVLPQRRKHSAMSNL